MTTLAYAAATVDQEIVVGLRTGAGDYWFSIPSRAELTRPKTSVYAFPVLSGSEDAIVSMFDEYGL